MLGAPRVLRALEEELKLQTEAGSGDLALDIATTIISAPMAESFTVDQLLHHPIDSHKDHYHHHHQQLPAPSTLIRTPLLTLRDALNLDHDNVPRISEKDPLRAEMIVRLSRRVNALTAPTAQVSTLDVSNIISNMPPPPPFERATGPTMDLEPSTAGGGGGGHEENLSQMLDTAAAAAAGGMQGMQGDANTGTETGADPGTDSGINVGTDMGTGLDTSIDDVLNAADMAAVGNPEFLDLDMEGMF